MLRRLWRKVFGRLGEDVASASLRAAGYAILARNFRGLGGEVDIIARKDGVLVMVEVKARSSLRFGAPEEAVDPGKARKIARCALEYQQRKGLGGLPVRLDIVAITARGEDEEPEVRIIENALELGEL